MKKTMIALVAGAVGLAMTAAVASAVDVNINGASAEFTYWTAVAPLYLAAKTSAGGAGCTGTPVVKQASSSQYLVTATGCSLVSDTITIRVASTNSLDGIQSALNQGGDANCTGRQRTMVKDTTGALSCQSVTLGASDVGGAAFGQTTTGNVNGPDDGLGIKTGYTTYVASPVTIPSTVDTYQPIVVPFGFYLHSDVKVRTCSAGSGTTAAPTIYVGQQCTQNSDCGTTGGTCQAAAPVQGISRLMAVQIFGGQVFNWTDFGAGYSASAPITVCMRHAGSGTLATLQWGVMRDASWGSNMLTTQMYPGVPGVQPETWFNNGTGTMMDCVNTRPGAIGYADADRLATNPMTNVYGPIAYNGFLPTRVNIRNGVYDDFWAAQHIYHDQAEPSYNATKPVVDSLMAYAGTPANMPSGKAPYWATQAELVYPKATDDVYPVYGGGASSPQSP